MGAIKLNIKSMENFYEEKEWDRFFNLSLNINSKVHVVKKSNTKC